MSFSSLPASGSTSWYQWATDMHNATHDHFQFSPMAFGAVGDGASHPLSTRYATLTAAQAVYPAATALTDEIDGCAIQLAATTANNSTGGVVLIDRTYCFNQQITILERVNLRGGGSGDAVSNFAQLKATGGAAQLQWGNGGTSHVRGGFSGGFLVNGNSVGGTSTGGLWFENRVTQRSFGDITVIDSAGDGCVRWYGQNCLYWNFDVHRSAGNNRTWDFGTGGHLMIRSESSQCGGYHDYFNNGAGGPYTVPTQITFINCLNERGSATTTNTAGYVHMVDGDRILYLNHIFAAGTNGTVAGPDHMLQVLGGDLILDHCTLYGNVTESGIRQETGSIVTISGRHYWKNLATAWTRNGGTTNLLAHERILGSLTRWAGTLGSSGVLRKASSLYARKPADQTVTNTTTLANDADLQITLDANSEYVFQSFIMYNATSTGDIKVTFNGPTGSTVNWVPNGLQSGIGSAATTGTVNMASSSSGGGRPLGGADAATDLAASPVGRVVTGSTGGTFSLQWAQNTAEASNCIVRAGSYLMVQKVG